MDSMKDGSHLYEVERRNEHAARPGFRITELQISPTQKVPWHLHSNVQDTFYVISGRLRIFLREPKEDIRLSPGDTYSVKARRPHLVTNGGTVPLRFWYSRVSANTTTFRSLTRYIGETDMAEVIGIDHIYIAVSDLARSERFYDVVMKALGFRRNEFRLEGDRHIQYYNRHFGYVLRPVRSDEGP